MIEKNKYFGTLFFFLPQKNYLDNNKKFFIRDENIS